MSAPSPKLLIADDDASIRLVLSHAFTRAGFQVRATASAATLLKWALEGEGDAIVTDVVMPDENVFDVLPRIRAARPNLPIVVMSAQNTVLTAVAAAERGAFDYVPKPFDLDDIIAVVRRALEPQGKLPRRPAGKSLRPAEPLLGRSNAMQGLYRSLARLVGNDAPVLISGEPGSGRSLIARALHDLGPQRDKPFTVIACSYTAAEALEAALAGEHGGGTVVLDGVDAAGPAAQACLAAWIDAVLAQPARGRPRIVAIAGAEMGARVADGGFGRALFDRVAVGRLMAPPLRDRPEDIPELARALLASLGDAAPGLAPAAEARLQRHDWPGNVRELHTLLRRLALMNAGPVIGLEAVAAELSLVPRAGEGGSCVDALLAQAVALSFAEGPLSDVHARLVQALERPMIAAALTAGDGAQLRAAAILGLNRNTLRKKITDLGLR
jgi:two-component system nitrogen regulation response regulator GlnG